MVLVRDALAMAGGVYATEWGFHRVAAGDRFTQKKYAYYYQEYSTIIRSYKLRGTQIKNIPTQNCSCKTGKNMPASAAR